MFCVINLQSEGDKIVVELAVTLKKTDFDNIGLKKNHAKKTTKTKTAIAVYSKADPPKKGDLCFGKVRGFVPWPAYVTGIEGSFAWVKFFNSTLK